MCLKQLLLGNNISLFKILGYIRQTEVGFKTEKVETILMKTEFKIREVKLNKEN